MARIGFTEERVGTPEGVKLQLQGDEVTVSGKLGSLQRRFPHPRVSLALTGTDLVIRSELEFVIENFLGERSPRRTRIVGETKVVVQGDQVVLTGSNVEDVGQTAANIERATKIRGFDPRVFQDGIYITSKGEEA